MIDTTKYLVVGGLGTVLLAGLLLAPMALRAYQEGRFVDVFAAAVKSTSQSTEETVVAPSAPASVHTGWVTIKPKGREACKRESNGFLDDPYRRCRSGRQELIREVNGHPTVVSERRIPAY